MTTANTDSAHTTEAPASVVSTGGFDLARKYFHPPFRYDDMGSAIMDRDGHKMLDVRGWGYLTGRGGGKGLTEATAAGIQDAIGRKTAELLNASWSNNEVCRVAAVSESNSQKP